MESTMIIKNLINENGVHLSLLDRGLSRNTGPLYIGVDGYEQYAVEYSTILRGTIPSQPGKFSFPSQRLVIHQDGRITYKRIEL